MAGKVRCGTTRLDGNVVHDPIVYMDGPEMRKLDLRPDGIACVPLLGQSRTRSLRAGTVEHVHPGCVEFVFCRRGSPLFSADGQEYPFLPGYVFVSGPEEPHRMCNNPKGLLLQNLLFRIPTAGVSVLGLPRAESRWLVRALTSIPTRLFPATDCVRVAFDRLFALYDDEPRGTCARRLKMRAAVLELLLALVEAPHAAASSRGRSNPKVRAIVERMRTHPEADYPLDALAREAALTGAAFTDAFRRETGLPPHAFLLDLRVRTARRDLAASGESVSAVARRYGFSSPQHFATVFRRILGVTPKSCRA